ncbi:ATP-binding protein [Croceicoccus sp. F390]|uniref:ATP-binding protein n=1 Tax=Croceicoccus esteveae TaxID=3075597 RepID=A0ABU2ZHX1_9SPHN|nr:ATP-binding protein [Croceicoccus sp. F390]MDT0576204.1 ATP-binding protein [Croceicoccus sp. F390]
MGYRRHVNTTVIIGTDPAGAPVPLDIEELLATRLLVQGNSGSGKSHLLRRLLEQSAGVVQQIVIDPEGDFVTLADPHGHVVIDAGLYAEAEIASLAGRVRRHRASVVLALDELEVEAQMRCAAGFLNALFDAPREDWYPALVVVDEAQMFAPSQGGDVSDDARRQSLTAMTNLMCRGRKRGLAGVIATQRLAKLAKNVAAEASNFLMGRTFLDIDMTRAADLLGMERRQAERIRDLERGRFLGLGPAISRRPVDVRIGSVATGTRGAAPGLLPLPQADAQEMELLLRHPHSNESQSDEPQSDEDGSTMAQAALHDASSASEAARIDANTVLQQLVAQQERTDGGDPPDVCAAGESSDGKGSTHRDVIVAKVLAQMAAADDAAFQSAATLFQDFTLRCRARNAPLHGMDMRMFNRRFAMALADFDQHDPQFAQVVELSSDVPEEMLAPFLAIAAAAQLGQPCPDDKALARIYGTNSPGRIRRLLENFERMELLVIRTDFAGRRTIAVPALGTATLPQ